MLVVARVIQGLAAGGEWGGPVLMAIEHVDDRRRGLWGSVGMMGVPTGVTLSTGVFALLVAAGGPPSYLSVAVFMLVVCLLSAGAAWFAPEMNQRALRTG